MRVELSLEKDSTLRVIMIGEIDHHAIGNERKNIDDFIKKNLPKLVVLDFSRVKFMDTSGIGLIIGRYKLACELKIKLAISNVPEGLKKIMRFSGIYSLNILQM